MNTLPFLGMITGVLVMYFGILKLGKLNKWFDEPNEFHSRTRYDVTDDLVNQIKSRKK